MPRIRLSALVLCLLFSAVRVHADAVADLAKYSIFPQVDLSSLSKGKIIALRGPALSFPRDLTVQSVYLVHAPLASALDMHKNWDAGRHPELKVYLHHDFSNHPTMADFALPIPDNATVRKLANATEKLPPLGELQLSKAEAAQYKASGSGAFPQGVRDFWSQILFKRASAFAQHGLSRQPPYDTAGDGAHTGDEISRLLKEQPKVRAAFHSIIDRSPLGGGSGSLPLAPYWELFDADNMGAFSLGAECSTLSSDSAQLLDLQYYASGGYYAYVTLYQLWPVTVDGKAATLVWRVDLLSTLSVADLGPFDRMGSGAAMSKEIQRIISYFQKDTGR